MLINYKITKRINLFALMILIVGQTIFAPIASTEFVSAEAENADESVNENLEEQKDNPSSETDSSEQKKSDEVTKEIDKNKLTELLNDIEEYKDTEIFADFIETFDTGKKIDESSEVTQDEVDSIVNKLEEAVQALQQKTSTGEAADDGNAEEDGAAKEEEVAESEEADDSDEEESDETSQTVQPFHHDGYYGFKLTLSEVMDNNGNPFSEDNPLGPNDEFKVKVKWELEDGHNYKPGEYETVQLPEQVYIPRLLEGELKDEASGEVIANYVVDTDGKVTLTFTEFIENHSQVSGWIEVFAQLDKDKVEDDDGKVTIDPIEDEGVITVPID